VSFGYQEWFIEKTPLNLFISLLLFFVSYPLVKKKQWLAFIIFFTLGMFAEWLGVKFSLLFGTYAYGANFGPKLDGVPLLIGCFWALLTFITSSMLDYTTLPNWLKVIFASLLMLLLDFFMEHSAPTFDFWTFEGNVAPLQNYVAWFGLALLFNSIIRIFNITGNKPFALHLYLAQLVFFMYFYFL